MSKLARNPARKLVRKVANKLADNAMRKLASKAASKLASKAVSKLVSKEVSKLAGKAPSKSAVLEERRPCCLLVYCSVRYHLAHAFIQFCSCADHTDEICGAC